MISECNSNRHDTQTARLFALFSAVRSARVADAACLSGRVGEVDTYYDGFNPLEWLSVSPVDIAKHCKNILNVCGQTDFRHDLQVLDETHL